jgi:hypothetical protein
MIDYPNYSRKRYRRLVRTAALNLLCILFLVLTGLALMAGTSNAAAAQVGVQNFLDQEPDLRLDKMLARSEQAGQSGITSPAPGSSVSGPVPIIGTATNALFARYELSSKEESSGEEAYSYFAGETRQVINGQLGVWRTEVLHPGTYTLRLRVVRPDGNYGEFFVNNVNVGRDPVTPTPDAPTPTPIPIDTPTPYPQPTVAEVQVEQPAIEGSVDDPTATPAPLAQDSGGGTTEGQASSPGQDAIVQQPSILGDLGDSLALDSLRARFFTGVRWSAGLFLLLAAVFAAKRLIEWVTAKGD